jgi:hypothetical protein
MEKQKLTKEEFFKEFELDMQMLPYGVEELGVSIALPKDAEQICWDFIMYNKIKIDEIIKVSDNFEFVSKSNFKFILTRKLKTEVGIPPKPKDLGIPPNFI